MAVAVEEMLDVVQHREQHPDSEYDAIVRLLGDRLNQPLTSDEAAEVLQVSRPTIHTWVKAGLLQKARVAMEGKRSRLWLDTLTVYRVASLLSRIQLVDDLRERAIQLQQLVDQMYYVAHPGEEDALRRAIGQAERGEFVEEPDEHVERDARARDLMDNT